MSSKNPGNKQIIVLHNCEINNQKYDLVITPHTQTVECIRTKRKTIKRKIISKQRQITRRKLSKHRNACSESEVSNLDTLYNLKDSANKNCTIHDQMYFSDSEATSYSSKQKKKNKKDRHAQTSTSIKVESNNQHIENYVLRVIKRKNEQHSK